MAKFLIRGLIVATLMYISGCSSIFEQQIEWGYLEPEEYPVLKATGYAPINAQLSENQTGKLLQAMKASKLEAYRELAEQVFGQKIDGKTSVQQMVLQDNQLNASIQGVIRGAQVIRTYPVGDDLYATELSLDMKKVHDIYLSVTKPKRIKKVNYF